MKEEKKLVPKRRFKEFVWEWKKIDLGSIGSTFSGLSGKTKNDFGHGTAEFVTYMNIFNNTISDINVTEKVVRDDKQTQLEYGDILFTTSSETPNEVGMSSVWLDKRPNVYLNSFCFGFRPTIKFDYYYIGYMLRANSFRKQMEILAQGISRYNISKAKVLETVVLLPSVQEQQKIGEFFKVLDERIANQERKIAKVKALKSAYLTEMFPQDGELVPKRRFKGFEGEWKNGMLGDFGTVEMNKRIFKWQTSSAGDVPFYKIGTFGQKADAFISYDIFNEYKLKYPYPNIGDILISASGSIGRTVVYNGEDAYFQDSNIVWLKHDGKLNNLFLKQFYKIVKWNGLEGSTIQRLYNKDILETQINIPPTYEEQQKIGEFFKNLDDQIITEDKKLEKLKKMKEAYLEEMFV
ncbi:restriction endonuclease subunit S [Pseudogracilibacillus sp. SO30301A]|uniref:restriction endonuclease subunit S n=1 Tax=Pseudogracilibacillus sp. SO30301A TaxID=3098291 RepID=UPI00300E5369